MKAIEPWNMMAKQLARPPLFYVERDVKRAKIFFKPGVKDFVSAEPSYYSLQLAQIRRVV